VNNAVKHANASHLWIEITPRGDGQLVLIVRDDGVGLPDRPAQFGGMGLQTMVYRARIIGGTVDVRRGESGGTVVTCTCPTAVTSASHATAGAPESSTAPVRAGERKPSTSRTDIANEVPQA
jgi:nitrate/nitrite-specific signal transduction histidine kinase